MMESHTQVTSVPPPNGMSERAVFALISADSFIISFAPIYSTFLVVWGEYVSKIWSKLVATLSFAMLLSRNTA